MLVIVLFLLVPVYSPFVNLKSVLCKWFEFCTSLWISLSAWRYSERYFDAIIEKRM